MVGSCRWEQKVMQSSGLQNVMRCIVVDCEDAHHAVPSNRGAGFCTGTGRLRYARLAPGCTTQSPRDGIACGGELKSPSRMHSLPSVSNVLAKGGRPLK